MKAIATPRITADGQRLAAQWRKKSPITYWPCVPILFVALLATIYTCRLIWQLAWQGYSLCAWIGIDLDR